MIRKCQKCGKELQEGQKFCPDCGTKYEDEKKNSGEVEAKQEPVNGEKKASSDKKKNALIILSVVVAAVIAVGAIFGISYLSEKQMKDALASKDIYQINEIYYKAEGKTSLLNKYDALIGACIESMKNDLNGQDFSEEAAQSGSSVVWDYAQDKWGDLLVSDDEYTLGSVVSAENSNQWVSLQNLYVSKTAFCNAMREYKQDADYENAIMDFKAVIADDSQYETANNLANECAKAYVESLQPDPAAGVSEEQLTTSLEKLEEVRTFLSDYGMDLSGVQSVTDAYVAQYVSATLQSVESSIANGDMNSGVQLLESAKGFLEENDLNTDSIMAKWDELMKTYAESYSQKAAEAFKQHDTSAAIGNIEVAMEMQPDNADYKSLHDNYQLYLPFALYEKDNILMEEKTHMFYNIYDSDIANDGTTYNNILELFGGSFGDKHSIELTYNLAGSYDTVTGKMFINRDNKNIDDKSYFKAYGDGKLLYTSKKMKKGVLPKNISFSVSGIQKLTIEVYGDYDTSLCLSNLVAQKKFPE